ncbi:unnamed protein product [Prorocentrum cordatum]|uniref:Uncharacterized protein n=1 Tax=Prorocentrum cordatum TaxID=2364126 RepID=A0ABN9V706_9DINO|nr:unnamed protein product [Polarella glacialis]
MLESPGESPAHTDGAAAASPVVVDARAAAAAQRRRRVARRSESASWDLSDVLRASAGPAPSPHPSFSPCSLNHNGSHGGGLADAGAEGMVSIPTELFEELVRRAAETTKKDSQVSAAREELQRAYITMASSKRGPPAGLPGAGASSSSGAGSRGKAAAPEYAGSDEDEQDELNQLRQKCLQLEISLQSQARNQKRLESELAHHQVDPRPSEDLGGGSEDLNRPGARATPAQASERHARLSGCSVPSLAALALLILHGSVKGGLEGDRAKALDAATRPLEEQRGKGQEGVQLGPPWFNCQGWGELAEGIVPRLPRQRRAANMDCICFNGAGEQQFDRESAAQWKSSQSAQDQIKSSKSKGKGKGDKGEKVCFAASLDMWLVYWCQLPDMGPVTGKGRGIWDFPPNDFKVPLVSVMSFFMLWSLFFILVTFCIAIYAAAVA